MKKILGFLSDFSSDLFILLGILLIVIAIAMIYGFGSAILTLGILLSALGFIGRYFE